MTARLLTACARGGGDLIQPRVGRRRRFCSPACRVAAHRADIDAAERDRAHALSGVHACALDNLPRKGAESCNETQDDAQAAPEPRSARTALLQAPLQGFHSFAALERWLEEHR